jgi:CRP-like cAMP-binding protein
MRSLDSLVCPPTNMDIGPLIMYMSQYIDLTSNEKNIISTHINFRKYLKGQYIVQKGDICKAESFVVKGCLKTFLIDNDGREHISMFAVENWWAADLASFNSQTPADFNIQCLENTEVIQFTLEKLEQLYSLIPNLERFFRIIIQKAFVASQKRIMNNFSLSARDRYLHFRQQYPNIEQRVPQYMIASYLGITKEFLSKIRSQFISEQ